MELNPNYQPHEASAGLDVNDATRWRNVREALANFDVGDITAREALALIADAADFHLSRE